MLERLSSLRPYTARLPLFTLLAGTAAFIALKQGTGAAILLFVLLFGAALLLPTSSTWQNHFLRRFALAAGLLLVAVGSFNYIVNPLGLYSTRFFEPIVFSTRTEKMRLYATRPVVPQALVLGSSRSFSVDPQQVEDLWGYPTFNASVTAGMINDYLAFLKFSSQTRRVPRLMIIDLESGGFLSFDNSIVEPNTNLGLYLNDNNTVSSLLVGWGQFWRLFSLEQTQTSVRLLQMGSHGREKKNYEVFPDGRIDLIEMLTLDEAISTALENNTFESLKYAFTVTNLDPSKMEKFRQILKIARTEQMTVLGYVPPFHPFVQQFLDAESEFRTIQTSMTQQFRRFEQDYPFHFIDFTDSSFFSGDQLDELFSDHIHVKEKGSRLMMQALHDTFPEGF